MKNRHLSMQASFMGLKWRSLDQIRSNSRDFRIRGIEAWQPPSEVGHALACPPPERSSLRAAPRHDGEGKLKHTPPSGAGTSDVVYRSMPQPNKASDVSERPGELERCKLELNRQIKALPQLQGNQSNVYEGKR
jgi:hypothetical protein